MPCFKRVSSGHDSHRLHVKLAIARTVDLFRREKKLPVYRSCDTLEWFEASITVAAKIRVRSRLRVLSRTRCGSTRSFAASVPEARLHERSFTASVPRATLLCERVRAYLNLRVRLDRSSNLLEYTRSETLRMLTVTMLRYGHMYGHMYRHVQGSYVLMLSSGA